MIYGMTSNESRVLFGYFNYNNNKSKMSFFWDFESLLFIEGVPVFRCLIHRVRTWVRQTEISSERIKDDVFGRYLGRSSFS